jgi:hypothetical protein
MLPASGSPLPDDELAWPTGKLEKTAAHSHSVFRAGKLLKK